MAAALVAPFLVLPAASSASAACAQVPDDFNGDGYSDLAVGAPYRHDPVGNIPAQGALHIAYGSAAGLAKGTAASVTITGRTPGLPVNRFSGSVQLADALASGYFDGDCYADLAVSGAGNNTFLLLYGSSAGLTSARSAAVDRATIQPGAEDGNSSFSLDLAAGDFNGDGFDDIAAGAPWLEDTSGAFGVVYGSVTGITGIGGQWITQDSPGVPGTVERGDVFGRTLAAGDFNGDGLHGLTSCATWAA